MGKVSFEQFQRLTEESSSGGDGIGFFSLKNDGDTATVRILHDSVDDFDIVATHQIKIGDKYRNISCLRNPGDSADKCPLCATGAKIRNRFYAHMIQYDKDDNGNVVGKPVVWERSAKDMAQKLVTLIEEYGPLSENILRVRRNGKAGDMHTTYEILPANTNIYRPSNHPLDCAKAFDGYNTLGAKVMDKTFDEIVTFLETGEFPGVSHNETSNKESATNNAESYTPANRETPNMQTSGMARPTRYY